MTATTTPTTQRKLDRLAARYWAARAEWVAAHQDATSDGPSPEVINRFDEASEALKAAILASRPLAKTSPDQPDLFAVVATARIGDWVFLVTVDPSDGQWGDSLLTPTPASLFV